MAVVFCEVDLPDNVVEFSSSSQQDVHECKRFWQAAYLQPQGESTLVCTEITQRLSKHSPAIASKYSRSSGPATSGTYKYVINEPISLEIQERASKLSKKQEESRRLFEKQTAISRDKDKPRLDLQAELASQRLFMRERRDMEEARRYDLKMSEQLSEEIEAFEKARNIPVNDDDESEDIVLSNRLRKARFVPDNEADQQM